MHTQVQIRKAISALVSYMYIVICDIICITKSITVKCIYKSKVQRLFLDSSNLLTVINCKINIKKEITYFQPITQDTHYCSKTQESEHSEEIMDQSKKENVLGKVQTLHFHV